MRAFSLAALFLLAVSDISSAAQLEWPRLAGAPGDPECRSALEIGKVAFQSDAVVLYALTKIPQRIGTKLVLGPKEADLSAGDALESDPHVFAKLATGNNGSRGVYWQKAAVNGVHWAVAERPMGWRGDMYSLFAVPHGTNPDALFAKYAETETANGLTPVVEDNWRPPLLLQGASAAVWAINVGQPFIPLGSWHVYVTEPGGARQACTIAFRPNVRDITSLLPSPVRRLAGLLGGTLGSGANEGTLQSTAQIRVGVAHVWANVALRPWALPNQPYNTRTEVNRALKSWSRRAHTFGTLYHSIQAQYPQAHRALAAYYRTRFSRTPEEADRFAAHALDVAFRTYFVFHREDVPSGSNHTSPNPWR